MKIGGHDYGLWICEFISRSQTKIPPNSAHESRNPRHIIHLNQCALLLRDSGKVSSHAGDLYSQTLPNRALGAVPIVPVQKGSGPGAFKIAVKGEQNGLSFDRYLAHKPYFNILYHFEASF